MWLFISSVKFGQTTEEKVQPKFILKYTSYIPVVSLFFYVLVRWLKYN